MSSCQPTSCEDLEEFKSENQAIKLVKEINFPFDKTHTLMSDEWMKVATYKSCDNLTGFFIFIDRNSGIEYMHQNVPMVNWLGFMQDAKKSNYYNLKIRGKFPLQLK